MDTAVSSRDLYEYLVGKYLEMADRVILTTGALIAIIRGTLK